VAVSLAHSRGGASFGLPALHCLIPMSEGGDKRLTDSGVTILLLKCPLLRIRLLPDWIILS
jgi:hypothetical protein